MVAKDALMNLSTQRPLVKQRITYPDLDICCEIHCHIQRENFHIQDSWDPQNAVLVWFQKVSTNIPRAKVAELKVCPKSPSMVSNAKEKRALFERFMHRVSLKLPIKNKRFTIAF